MRSWITRKGKVTLPQEVCELLGVESGDDVDFEITDDGRVVIVASGRNERRRATPSRFSALRGTATVKMTTEQIMALTRPGE